MGLPCRIKENIFLFLVGLISLSAFGDKTSSSNIKTFDDIQQLIESGKVQSVEKFLAALPPALRSNFTLVYQSKSIQGASPEKPRVILSSKTGDLVITFNGDPSQDGYNSVEVMDFSGSGASRKATLHEIEFDPRTRASPKVSTPNPDKCVSCHGSPPLPIWAGYPIWNGVYGAYDDELMSEKNPPPTQDSNSYVAGLDVKRDERKNFISFKQKSKGDLRYKNLVWGQGDNSPYLADHESFSPTNLHSNDRPNMRLTLNLEAQGGFALASLIKQSPYYQKYGNSLLYVSTCRHEKLLKVGDGTQAAGASWRVDGSAGTTTPFTYATPFSTFSISS